MSLSLVDDFGPANVAMKNEAIARRVARILQASKDACSEDETNALSAAFQLSELLAETRSTSAPDAATLAGPLTHALTKMMNSKNREVLTRTLAAIKFLTCDDNLRKAVSKVSVFCKGVVKLLDAHASNKIKDVDTARDLLATCQNLLWDSGSAFEFAKAGGLHFIGVALASVKAALETPEEERPVDALERGAVVANFAQDSECRACVLACATNGLSHCDKTSTLGEQTHEMRPWIDDLVAALASLLRASATVSDDTTRRGIVTRAGDVSIQLEFAASALANATRDGGLSHAIRTANGIEPLEKCARDGSKVNAKASERCKEAMSRLSYTSGLRSASQSVRFRWGGSNDGGKMDLKLTSKQNLGMFAVLCIASAFAGSVALGVLRMSGGLHFEG